MSLIPPALVGPRCTDPDGFPRYAATIWLDFLHAHQAVATREKHALSIGRLYRDAEAMNPSVDLDSALMTANILDLERVLSSALIGHQAHGSDDKRWAVQKRFVFGFLATVIGAESPDLTRELKRLERTYAQLRSGSMPRNIPVRSVPADVLEDLFEVIRPDSFRNPFRTEVARLRNFIIFLLLFQLGLRLGEMLLLTPDSFSNEFDFRTGTQVYWVTVEASAQHDIRARAPRLKNGWASRQLPLSKELVSAIDIYVSQCRGNPPHAFLLSSQEGRPLSRQSVDLVFAQAKKRLSKDALQSLHVKAGGGMSPHSLRHTAAVVRFQRFADSGMSHDEMVRRMRPFFGWAPGSEMPFHYARAFFDPRYAKMWDETFDDALSALRHGAWA